MNKVIELVRLFTKLLVLFGFQYFIIFFIAVAIDLIVQHIRDFLNNRSKHDSTSNLAMNMNNSCLTSGGGKNTSKRTPTVVLRPH